MLNLSKKQFIQCAILNVLFLLLCVVLYKYNIAIYLLYFIVPSFINTKYSKSSEKSFITCCLDFIAYVALNTMLLEKEYFSFINVDIFVIQLINIIIISVCNIYLYLSFGFCLFKNNKLPQTNKYLILYTIIFCILSVSIYQEKNISTEYVLISLLIAMLYTFIMKELFSKNIGIFVNFVLSTIPLSGLILGYISIVFILQTFDISHFRYVYLSNFYILPFYISISLSSLAFLFTKKTKLRLITYQIIFGILVFLIIIFKYLNDNLF